MTEPADTDPIMTSITDAVGRGRDGHVDEARTRLLEVWHRIGVNGNPLHRCSLAHYLADLFTDPAQALAWDVRALDAADADANLEAFYPSLHLNLADDYRRLGSFDAAREHLDSARAGVSSLPSDAYGDLIRETLERVTEAVGKGETAALPPTGM